jgi:hypothetical protein
MKAMNDPKARPAGMTPAVATIIDQALGAAAAAGIDVTKPNQPLSAFVAEHLATEVMRLRRAAGAASAGFARLPPTRPTMAPKPRPPAAI